MAAKKPENMNFEESLQELEQIVQQLEQGELNLEQSLKSFERGISLANVSQSKLAQAQQQVKILRQAGQQESLQDFVQESQE